MLVANVAALVLNFNRKKASFLVLLETLFAYLICIFLALPRVNFFVPKCYPKTKIKPKKNQIFR